MYKGPGTLGYTWAITPRATAVQDREANEHRQANLLKDSQRPEAQQAHRGTRPGTGRTSSGTPPLGAHSGAPGDTPKGGGSGGQRSPSAPGAHGSPPGAPRRPECACPCVRARPCAPPPVGGEVRTAPGAARLARRGVGGERLPWCAERGRILMGRPRALPPCPPGSLVPLLQFLRSHPGPWPRAATPPLKGPEPRGAVRRPGSLDPRVLDSPQRRPRLV